MPGQSGLARVTLPAGSELAISVDTLVSGVHFPNDTQAADIGYKAMAVNLSDMAAMGAAPIGVTLALTLPVPDSDWTRRFLEGLNEAGAPFGVRLLSLHTRSGPLCVTAQIHGSVPAGGALLRAGAQPGDGVYVTGTLGDAGLGLGLKQGKDSRRPEHDRYLLGRLDRPTPRVREGLALRGFATAAIDISDGLAADLGHILAASGVGASLDLDRLPLSRALQDSLYPREATALALGAGDDYELCFTLPPARRSDLEQAWRTLQCPLTPIGTIEAAPGLRCRTGAEPARTPAHPGYQHFG